MTIYQLGVAIVWKVTTKVRLNNKERVLSIMNHKNGLRTSVMSVVLLGMVGLLSACGGGSTGGGGSGSGGATRTLMGGSILGTPLVLANSVSTFSGSAGITGSADGTSAARFNSPYGLTTDGANLYVVDTGNSIIRKIVIATGAVTTVAGGVGVVGSTDGTVAESFNNPNGITTDGTNLYVVDNYNQTIRKIIIATGEVSTLAGSVGVPGSVDGTGAAARFRDPAGITTDGVNLYVADRSNYTIRKIVIATGAVTTVAGSTLVSGAIDDIGAAARFYGPYGITTDGVNLYVSDTFNQTIRKIVIATGAVSTLAGSAGVMGSVDGTGTARFKFPHSITTDGTNLYVSDYNNQTIRKIVIATGEVTTVAGSVGVIGSADGTAAARFNYPEGITTDGANLYVADGYNHIIRKIQ